MQRLGVDRLGMHRLGQAGGASVGITIPDPPPELADGVWAPGVGTWAKTFQQYLSLDDRVWVSDGIQQSFNDTPRDANGWPIVAVEPDDIYKFITRSHQFTAPDTVVGVGDELLINKYSTGGRLVIEHLPTAAADEIGLLRYYSSDGSTVITYSPVVKNSTVRTVTAIGHVDATSYILTSSTGHAIRMVTVNPNIPGWHYAIGSLILNPAIEGWQIGYSFDWPLGDPESPRLAWIRATSDVNVEPDVLRIDLWPAPTTTTPSTGIQANGQALNANGVPIVATG